MKKISYSQYTTWANCGHAWKLKYVDGHRFDDTSIHTIFGTAMHETIQEWLEILYNQSENVGRSVYLNDGFKDKLLTLFKENITVSESGEKTFLTDKPTLMEFYEHGCQILTYIQNNYKKIFPTTNVKLHSIEFPLEIEIRNGVQYIGYIDVVTFNEETGKYVLYDLKTSRSGWTEYQKKDPVKVGQLLLYKRFFSQQLGIDEKNISVEFVVLKRIIAETTQYPIPRVSKFEPPNGPPSMTKSWAYFQKFVDTCFSENGDYITAQEPKPSIDACKWCVYKDKPDLCSVAVRK